jgi:hypothetical protein
LVHAPPRRTARKRLVRRQEHFPLAANAKIYPRNPRMKNPNTFIRRSAST